MGVGDADEAVNERRSGNSQVLVHHLSHGSGDDVHDMTAGRSGEDETLNLVSFVLAGDVGTNTIHVNEVAGRNGEPSGKTEKYNSDRGCCQSGIENASCAYCDDEDPSRIDIVNGCRLVLG